MIPRNPTLIPCISSPIPYIPNPIPYIATLIPRIPTLIICVPTLITRVSTMIPRVSFLDSPFQLLQIATYSLEERKLMIITSCSQVDIPFKENRWFRSLRLKLNMRPW